MTWQLFIILYLIASTAFYLTRRKLATSLAKYNRLINGFALAGVLYPLGLIVAFVLQPNLAIGWQNIVLLLAGSLLFPLVNVLSFRANKELDAGMFTIFSNITPVVTIAAAWLLLNETLTDLQLLGAVVIISSAFMVTARSVGRTLPTRGILYALLAVSLLGLAIVFERWMLTRIDFGAYLVYGWGAQTVWAVIMAWPERKRLGQLFARSRLRGVIVYAVANACKGLFFIAALKLSENASVIGAYIAFNAVLVVVAAYIILGERESMLRKLTAAALGTAGLIILSI